MIDWPLQPGESILWEDHPRLAGTDPMDVAFWAVMVVFFVISAAVGYELLMRYPDPLSIIVNTVIFGTAALMCLLGAILLPLRFRIYSYCLTNRRLLKANNLRHFVIDMPLDTHPPVTALGRGTLRVGETAGYREDSRWNDRNEARRGPSKCILLNGLPKRDSLVAVIEMVKRGMT